MSTEMEVLREKVVEQVESGEKDPIELRRAIAIERSEQLLAAVWPDAMAGDDKAGRLAGSHLDRINELQGLKQPREVAVDRSGILRALDEAGDGEALDRIAAGEDPIGVFMERIPNLYPVLQSSGVIAASETGPTPSEEEGEPS